MTDVIITSVSVIVFTLFLLFVWRRRNSYGAFFTMESIPTHSVFITGCDSGFGQATALALHRRGMKVYAACLRAEGVEVLHAFSSSSNSATSSSPSPSSSSSSSSGAKIVLKEITAFKCDITKDGDIENALSIVSAGCPNGLWALINNAGVGDHGPIELTSMAIYRKIMEVNFFGHVAVTKTFLPLIRKDKGRVINVTSMAGTVAAPRLSAYCSSKFALTAFNDCLRREMAKFGVTVVNIAPGFMKTAIIENGIEKIEKLWQEMHPSLQGVYSDADLEKIKQSVLRTRTRAESPQLVVDQIVAAVFHKHPQERYSIGKNTAPIDIMLAILPTFITDFLVNKLAD